MTETVMKNNEVSNISLNYYCMSHCNLYMSYLLFFRQISTLSDIHTKNQLNSKILINS